MINMSQKLLRDILLISVCTNIIGFAVCSHLYDLCEFWPNRDRPDAEIHSQMRDITKFVSPENVQLTLTDFTTDTKFIEKFENEFNDTMIGMRLKWHTNFRVVYTILLKNYLPKTLGCIYKPDYHIAALEDKVNVTVKEIVQHVTDSVFYDIAFTSDCLSLPLIVMEERRNDNCGCFFGDLFTSTRYMFVECILSEPHDSNTKSTRVIRMKKACATNQEIYFSDVFDLPDSRDSPKNSTENPIELEQNKLNITRNKILNITANERWQPLLNNNHFQCNNCTINLIMGN